jgi:oxygen-independent coproporphyrinogen-3 oxidase
MMHQQTQQCSSAAQEQQTPCWTQPLHDPWVGSVAERGSRSVYLHIPFCFHKCHYCDFFSVVDNPEKDRQGDFLQALIREMRAVEARWQPRPRTMFVGGGTPTLLRADLWEALITELSELGWLKNISEWTVEANPETVTDEILGVLKKGGVTRLSMGAQSFDPVHLKTLERWHDPASVRRAVDLARSHGFDNLNLDLIFAVPGQSMADLDRDLDRLLELDVEHLACYSLIFEPKTAMYNKLQLGRISPVGDDLEAAMYQRVIERLTDAGYEQYEISNFSCNRPCEHNLIYWRSEDWIGVGPSASSHIDGLRWKNVADLRGYLRQSDPPAIEDVERLSEQRRLGEAMMMAIRLNEGIPVSWVDKMPAEDERHAVMDQLFEHDLLEKVPGFVRLTMRGRLLADAVAAKLL